LTEAIDMTAARARYLWKPLSWKPVAAGLALFACGKDANEPREGPTTIAIVAGGVQQGVVGEPLDTPLTVRITDHRTAPVSGVEVRFWIIDQNNGQVAPEFDTTDVDGLARSVWTLGTFSGYTLHALATAAGLDTVIFTAAPEPGPPAEVVFIAGDSQSAVVGTALDSEVVARVRDQYGNVVPSATVDFAITAGTGQVVPTTTPTDSHGLVRAVWTMGANPGYDTLSATAGGATGYLGAEAHPAPSVDSVALGITHTCRLHKTGQTSCWGWNFSGEVGSGDTAKVFTPQVLSGAPQFHSITAGGYHSCGLTAPSQLYCWGTMQTLLGLAPTAQVFPQTFASVSAGWNFMCGTNADHQGFCWGDNAAGQLGNTSVSTSPVPLPVSGGLRYRHVGAGISHACGLTTNGRAHCWGSGPVGRAEWPNLEPFRSLRFVSIAVGWEANCGLTLSGEAWCWGGGDPGRISSPVRFTSLAAGGDAFCGVASTGAGYCWGHNHDGQLGDNTQTDRPTPGPVSGGLVFSSIHMGQIHACGVTPTEELHCWGGGGDVFLGIGETDLRRAPAAVLGGLQFTSVTAGDRFTCGVTTAEAAYCWGWNATNRLGDGTDAFRVVPTAVTGGFTLSQMSLGQDVACGVTTSAVGICWGANNTGQLGRGDIGPPQATPAPVSGGLTLAEIGPGNWHTCARTTGGAAYCWGENTSGQIGDSSLIPRTTPVPVAGGHSWLRVRAGANFSCGRTTGGWARCWGAVNALGNGGVERAVPDSVHLGVPLTSLAVSSTSIGVCGVGSNQATYCWGNGEAGQLGDGSTLALALTPVPVAGGHVFQDVGVGRAHACGLTAAGVAYCWGDNSRGSLGDGTLISHTTPVAVTGGHVFSQLAVGDAHVCGLDATGAAWCWGENYQGQLGIGVAATSLTPVRVE
jgi:alpha-tubulin suppressor-like RCC1 family protein